jgi:hypothetical protein
MAFEVFDTLMVGGVFGVTFAVYYFDVRKDCRWMAWLAAFAMAGLVYAIERYVKNAEEARTYIQYAVLGMIALSMPMRTWFGNKNCRRAAYREHRIKATRFLPW